MILADDVGMGKTREALGAVTLHLAEHPRHNVVFLVPPALLRKWKEEIQDFVKAATQLPRSPKVDRALRRLSGHSDEWVLSTGKASTPLVRRCHVIVLDEAHKARNPRSQLSESLRSAIAKSKVPNGPLLLFLTATPFQCDHYVELINLLSFMDRLSESEEEDPEDGEGFHSIVGAIAWGLRQIKRRLKELEENPESARKTVAEILAELNRNLDKVHDPHDRTFGVQRGHDGFDEYLRALVVRTTKPAVQPKPLPLELTPLDAVAYLLGRAYLRTRRRAGRDATSVYGDPPPGGGFLPNGYSRLCSAYASQVTRQRKRRKTGHPHVKIVDYLRRGEGAHARGRGHTKIRQLIRVLEECFQAKGRSHKCVIFANHTATVQQLRHVLAKQPFAGKIVARADRRAPKLKDLERVRPLLRSRRWSRAVAHVSQSGLDQDEIQALREAITRRLALTSAATRQSMLGHYASVLASLDAETAPRMRRRIRWALEGRLRGSSRRLTRGLRLRHFRAVEYLDGSVDMRRRHRLLQAFNSAGAPPFVLIVSQAGSEGQNMHGACRQVIHYDLHWNPTVIHQRTGRVYRDRVKKVDVRELALTAGYDSTILGYAAKRDAYRDFLLGEKELRHFLSVVAQNGTRHPGDEWKMDLSPDRLSIET